MKDGRGTACGSPPTAFCRDGQDFEIGRQYGDTIALLGGSGGNGIYRMWLSRYLPDDAAAGKRQPKLDTARDANNARLDHSPTGVLA